MTDQATNRKMMIGTEGNPDYLVAAVDNGFALGIKPLLIIGQDQSQFGFRVRMELDKDSQPDIVNEKANLELMQKTFAGIPWGKRSAERFSTMLWEGIGYGAELIDNIEKAITDGLEGLLMQVETKIEPVKFIDRADLLAFLTERYTEALNDVREHIKPKTEQKQAGVADVLQFPGSGPDNDEGDIE